MQGPFVPNHDTTGLMRQVYFYHFTIGIPPRRFEVAHPIGAADIITNISTHRVLPYQHYDYHLNYARRETAVRPERRHDWRRCGHTTARATGWAGLAQAKNGPVSAE